MGRDGEGDKIEVKGWKRRGKDWPDQCQTASYAPVCGLPQSKSWRYKLADNLYFVASTKIQQNKYQLSLHTIYDKLYVTATSSGGQKSLLLQC